MSEKRKPRHFKILLQLRSQYVRKDNILRLSSGIFIFRLSYFVEKLSRKFKSNRDSNLNETIRRFLLFHLKYSSFNRQEWVISFQKQLTMFDVWILKAYVKSFSAGIDCRGAEELLCTAPTCNLTSILI